MRIEKDLLGSREVPNSCYYGIQTIRALENFDITGIAISRYSTLVHNLGAVKKAAAITNLQLGVLLPDVADAIVRACDEVMQGKHDAEFVVDVIQGGAGTSTNMNANEVIANRAIELLGGQRGDYGIVNPNDHVNCSQSTNDVYPTALRISVYQSVYSLMQAMSELEQAFADKGAEFTHVVKMGRTQLQDAVPMTLGQEFSAFATNVAEDIRRLDEARTLMLEVNLGATAIGTSINAPIGYPEQAVANLQEITGFPVVLSANLIEATWDTGAYVQMSGVLKRVAIKLSKICNDLRLLSSGPRAGLNEINLPPMQPGSSIMPGKVNPVIPEVVNQVCFMVIGNDTTISFAAEAGQLQLNVMEPVIAHCLFQSIDMLIRACNILRSRCITGITANKERLQDIVENSIGIVTALNPILGYSTASEVAIEAFKSGKSVREVVSEKGLLPPDKLEELLALHNLVNQH